MGNSCCFSCDEEKLSQSGDSTERTRLLPNVVGNSSQNQYGDDVDFGRPPSNQKGDEQSALNRILHQTATNVIDVMAIDAHNLEQHEYMDRARQYTQKLATANMKSIYTQKRPCLLKDVPAPERILTAELTPMSDLHLISSAADKAAKALTEVKVEHKDDLVVQFGIP